MEVLFDIQPEPLAERIAVRVHRTVLAYSREIAVRDGPALSLYLALLLDRPQPIGFVLVGIIGGRRRDQLRAFLPKMIETTASLRPASVC
jgi:hypothetical protein